MNEIKKGDCVQLKHGGHTIKMTVEEIRKMAYGDIATCRWFDTIKHEFKKEAFDVEALKPCDA